MPGRSVDSRHQLHGSCAQQITNQQKQSTAVSRNVHVPGIKITRTIDPCTSARSVDLLHRQQHYQERFDGEWSNLHLRYLKGQVGETKWRTHNDVDFEIYIPEANYPFNNKTHFQRNWAQSLVMTYDHQPAIIIRHSGVECKQRKHLLSVSLLIVDHVGEEWNANVCVGTKDFIKAT